MVNLVFQSLLLYSLQSATVNSVKISGILCDELNSNDLSAFNLGLEYFNNDATLLPNTAFEPLISNPNWTDAYSNIDASSVKATHAICAGFHTLCYGSFI